MAKILVGIATVSPDQRFLGSLPSFFRTVSRDHQLDCHWVFNKPLDEAQNEIGTKTLEGSYDYLLTIEDDHYEFTAEMLDSLITADKQVCGISYRSRHYPFAYVPMKYTHTSDNDIRLFKGQSHPDGIHETDLVGFGFTLIKKEVFEILEFPWFVYNKENHIGCGPNATDMQFSFRLQKKGIKLFGCWDYFLPHRDITETSWQNYLVKAIPKKTSLFTHLINGGVPKDANLASIGK